MKSYHIVLSLILLTLGGCGSHSLAESKQFIENRLDETTYEVIVPQEDKISSLQAKQLARQRAAEMTVDHGYRYFTIESEQEVQLLAADKSESLNPPTNLYQELIIDKNYSRDTLQRQLPSNTNLVPANRLVFKMYKERPLRRFIDACTLTECSEDSAS